MNQPLACAELDSSLCPLRCNCHSEEPERRRRIHQRASDFGFFTSLRTTAMHCKQNSRKRWLLAAFMCDVAYTAFLRSHYRDQVSGVLSKELSAVTSSPSGLPYSVRAISVRGGKWVVK